MTTQRSNILTACALGLTIYTGGIVAAEPAPTSATAQPAPERSPTTQTAQAEPDALIATGLRTPVRIGPKAEARVKWWREARFGMFIHFGVYAVPGRGEWVMFNQSIPHSEYARFADEFTPDPDAPKRWAELAKQAGMKYVVLTARHHDGFSLFDSHSNAFNSVQTAAKTDIVRTFTDAVRNQGLRVGLYYSPLDWRFPGYFMPDLYRESAEAMREIYHQEMRQLTTEYGHLDLIWYDGGGENWLGFGGLDRDKNGWKRRDKDKPYNGKFSWQDDLVNTPIRQRHPDIMINDRTSSIADWRTREGKAALGDFEGREPWELCYTLAGPWGYSPNAKPRSLSELVVLLTNTASRDGNLLLNIGPDPKGSVPPDQIARLLELGKWLDIHGQAIHGTRGGPFLPTPQVTSTRRDSLVYLHVLPDENGVVPRLVRIPRLNPGPEFRSARLLATQAQVSWRPAGELIEIDVPIPPEGSPTVVIELTFADSVMGLAPIPVP
jgi:alpha-L-fucosidase